MDGDAGKEMDGVWMVMQVRRWMVNGWCRNAGKEMDGEWMVMQVRRWMVDGG
jgi:hypothetical protein